ncbi:MAG: hypothetical protein L7S70_05425 [Pseudomonadales bacterium]|jgi:hypothetical protein|nr:hypothetical protein [Pseudomonadales bacterium]MBL6815898.1 hypothetical protein [Pseudomonadales bacterium]MCH1599804.1 hypothetical protein [Pseudomonadales bacterium]
MQQQINLYLDEFRVVKDPITAELMGKTLAAVLVVMLTIASWDLNEQRLLGNELAALRETLAEETRKTEELDEQLTRRSQNTELTDRLTEAEARYAAGLQIREFLSETNLGNVDGFSEYFKDLSRASIDGLSITAFQFTDGGEQATMSGQVRDSAIVPRYVQNIESGQSPLRNKTFSPSISRAEVESQIFTFELSTTSE